MSTEDCSSIARDFLFQKSSFVIFQLGWTFTISPFEVKFSMMLGCLRLIITVVLLSFTKKNRALFSCEISSFIKWLACNFFDGRNRKKNVSSLRFDTNMVYEHNGTSLTMSHLWSSQVGLVPQRWSGGKHWNPGAALTVCACLPLPHLCCPGCCCCLQHLPFPSWRAGVGSPGYSTTLKP